MKKISLQIRITILFSSLLTLICIILTLSLNVSAHKMVQAVPIQPAMKSIDEVVILEMEQPKILYSPEQRTFQKESIYYMLTIIIVGTLATYLVTGRVLKPINELANNIKGKNVNNLNDKLPLPKYRDEVYYLTLAFDEMSNNLKKSFQLQKQFSSDVSHELRTPLAVMQTKLEVFKLSNNTDKNYEIVDDMLEQLKKLNKLIDDLLWFSKDTPLENVEYVNLYVIAVDMYNELLSTAEEKNITITIQKCEFTVRGNDALLERVLYNLLQNAIKYSPPNTTIGINFDDKNKIVSVWDEGESIEEKQLIFEPFYRVNKYGADKGNGLGLSICKKILEKHNATIEVENNLPTGNVFKIKFKNLYS